MSDYYEPSADDGCRLYLVEWRERVTGGEYYAESLAWSESGDRAILCIRNRTACRPVKGTLWTAAVRDADWMRQQRGEDGIQYLIVIHPNDADTDGFGWDLMKPETVYAVLRQREREERERAAHPALPLPEQAP